MSITICGRKGQRSFHRRPQTPASTGPEPPSGHRPQKQQVPKPPAIGYWLFPVVSLPRSPLPRSLAPLFPVFVNPRTPQIEPPALP